MRITKTNLQNWAFWSNTHALHVTIKSLRRSYKDLAKRMVQPCNNHEFLTLIVPGHDCMVIWMSALWLKGLWPTDGKKSNVKSFNRDPKADPEMLAKFQVKDAKITIKQRRRMIFGWDGDLEHLIRDSEWFIDTKYRRLYITHWIAMYEPRTKDPMRLVCVVALSLQFRNHIPYAVDAMIMLKRGQSNTSTFKGVIISLNTNRRDDFMVSKMGNENTSPFKYWALCTWGCVAMWHFSSDLYINGKMISDTVGIIVALNPCQ